MIETVVGGLIVAAVSALTWVAYNHPSDYQRASPRLMLASIWGFSLVQCWFFSHLYHRMTVEDGLRDAGFDDAAKLTEKILEQDSINIAAFSVGLFAWMALLVILEFWVSRLKKEDAGNASS